MTYYTKDHEWLACEDGVATVGITRHAADALGDLVFIEVEAIGSVVAAEGVVATVESVKAASEIYAPAAGTIVEINAAVVEDPATISADPEGQGWLFKLKLDDAADLARLMDRAAYDALLADN